jgi:hypothetical protein
MFRSAGGSPPGIPIFRLICRNDPCLAPFTPGTEESEMNSIIYLIGLIVVVLAILSFLGLH